MKRIAILISFLFVISYQSWSQERFDALLAGRQITGATARSLSMGGAFGALGGDLSVAGTNPAGLAVFRNTVFTVTPGIHYATAQSKYNNEKNEDYQYKMTLDNLGLVWAENNGSTTGWAGGALGFSFNKSNDFDQSVIFGPTIGTSSLLDDFVDNLNGVGNYAPSENYEWLAYDVYLIDVDTLGNYYSDFDGSGYGQYQRKSINRSGWQGEFSFSAAGNIANKLFVGATLGMTRFTYDEFTDHFENDENGRIDYFMSFKFRESYAVSGKSLNMKLGLLAKPTEFIRLGAAVHLPSKIELESEFQTSVNAALDFTDGLYSEEISSDLTLFEYNITMPFKSLFSLGFVIGKFGLIDIDYETVDYSKLKLSSSMDDLSFENDLIKEEFKRVDNLKVGGEFNLGLIALRGGYAFYGDPFVSSHENAGQSTNAITGGVGFRSKDYFLDLGVMNYKMTEDHFLYGENKGQFETSVFKILATIGFKF